MFVCHELSVRFFGLECLVKIESFFLFFFFLYEKVKRKPEARVKKADKEQMMHEPDSFHT